MADDLPTVFRVGMQEVARIDRLVPLANGAGVTLPEREGDQFRVVDVWFDPREGFAVDLSPV
jgi:hypothetical protein